MKSLANKKEIKEAYADSGEGYGSYPPSLTALFEFK